VIDKAQQSFPPLRVQLAPEFLLTHRAQDFHLAQVRVRELLLQRVLHRKAD
jgi:hypothetical protein